MLQRRKARFGFLKGSNQVALFVHLDFVRIKGAALITCRVEKLGAAEERPDEKFFLAVFVERCGAIVKTRVKAKIVSALNVEFRHCLAFCLSRSVAN